MTSSLSQADTHRSQITREDAGLNDTTSNVEVQAREETKNRREDEATNSFPHIDHELSHSLTSKSENMAGEGDLDPNSDGSIPNPVERVPTPASDLPYSSFTSYQKVFIVLVSTLGGCFSPFTANIYFPAIDTISRSLGVSVTKVNLTITTYMIFQGIAPSFISAVADRHGRRPAYVIGFAVYMAANLGLALNNSYAGLLVLRMLQSSGSSGLATLNQGTVADIVTSAERGKYISITSLSSVLAPSLAPIAGGLLAQNLGWHSVFWFLLIMSGVYFIPLALFFPETARTVVGDGSLQPPKWNRTLLDVIRNRREKHARDAEQGETENVTTHAEVEQEKAAQKRRRFNPLAPFTVIADPETALLLVAVSIMYAAFYAISTSLTVQFHAIYNLSTSFQGLLFLPQVVGTILAAITNSRILDWQYRRHARKAGMSVDRKKQINILTTKLPIERARLEVAMPMLTAACVSTIIYGWLLQARVNIAGPIIMLVVNGYCCLAGFNVLSVLIIDLHRKRAATASAASNLVRCLLGAGASAVINPIIDAIGVGWTFTLVGLLVFIVIVPSLGWCMLRGHLMRAKRAEKERRKVEMEMEKEREREEVESKDVPVPSALTSA